jgi:hypothetical protein
VSVWLTWYKRWQPGRSGDEPALRIASDTAGLQAEKSIASTFRRTGSSRAERKLHAQPNSKHRRTKISRIDEGGGDEFQQCCEKKGNEAVPAIRENSVTRDVSRDTEGGEKC